MRAVIVGIATALTLTACGGTPEPDVAPVTETQSSSASTRSPAVRIRPEPDYGPAAGGGAPAPAPSSDNSLDTEIAELALEMTWQKWTPEEQVRNCSGWRSLRQQMLDAFMSGAGDGGIITSGDTERFFDRKCG